jgi:putative transposase
MNHQELSIYRQCELLGLSRASYYRQPAGETDKNLQLMRLKIGTPMMLNN